MAYNFRSQMEAIEAIIPRLYHEIYQPVGEVDLVAYRSREPMPFEKRTSGKRIEVKKGNTWGEKWDCAWFRITGTIPESAKGRKVILYLDINGEMGIYDKNGNILRGLSTGTALNVSRDYGCFGIRKRVLEVTESALGGESFEFWGDAGCNHITGISSSNRPELGKITHTEIAVSRENVKELFYDAFVLYDTLQVLSEESARYHRIRQSLFDASCELYDYTDGEIEKALAILKPELNKEGGDADLKVTAIGHSHIDLAWLWPIRETKRKGVRTFANALYYMEKYPDYVFGASQPQLYQWVKEKEPELYEKIKKKVEEGRWEVQGAMWCEPDANITGGESFVRQILYGKRFFRQEFMQDMKIIWLPDVFGYSAALPQIMKKSGVPYFLTIKLGWGNRHNKHPHNTFVWRGLDGSEVLAHMPPENDYSSFATPKCLHKIEREYKDKSVCDEALWLFGIGDGGGGAGELQHEALKREKNLSGFLPVSQGRAVEFFDRIAEHRGKYATYNGELYFEMHQGTYTTQARNKWYNRKMEKLLREAEFASVATGSSYPKEQLDEIWKEVLLYQFHDILPGSSVKRVYDECIPRYEAMYQETKKLLRDTYGSGDYAINSLSWDRCGWEKIGSKWYRLTVPAMGSIKLTDELESNEKIVDNLGMLENDAVKVVFDADGAILSVYDKKASREVLKERSNVFSVYFDNGNAWDMNELYRMRTPKVFTMIKAEAFQDGPKKGIRQEYVFGDSRLWQTISILDESPIVTFEVKVDWQESEKMLRTAFYTTVVTNEVTCDIQYGSIKRPTHNNTSWDIAKFEICAHKYADLSDSDYGVALMNDCKYGYCVKDGMLDLNLLRSAKYPSEEATPFRTDNGVHRFTYALYPHSGNVKESDVIQKSYELNQPLQTGKEVKQLFTISNPDIVVESVKKAEDGDAVIVRMYETKGGNAETGLKFAKPAKSAYLVDLMEENEKQIDLNNIPFHGFEIVTIKINI